MQVLRGDDLKRVIRFLVDSGIDPRGTNKEGSNNALNYICQYYRSSNLLKIVRHLVEQCQVYDNLQDVKGQNALHFLHMFNRDLNRLDVVNYILIKSLWRDQEYIGGWYVNLFESIFFNMSRNLNQIQNWSRKRGFLFDGSVNWFKNFIYSVST